MAELSHSRNLTEVTLPGGAALQEWMANAAAFCARWFPYLYLATAGVFALALCFINPPLEVPDEPHHFFKACQISYLDFRPHFQAGMPGAGAILPVAVNDFAVDQLSPEFRTGNFGSPFARFAKIRAKARTQTSPRKFGFIPFADEMIYNPIYYVPQAAGIALARFFSPHVYTWFYAARLMNALCAVLLVFAALLLSRAQQVILATVAILPMCLTQMASVSPDACLIGGSILFVSLCLRLRDRGGRVVEWICLALGIWLMLGRPVLFPAALLPLVAGRRIGNRKALGLCFAMWVIAGGISLLWAHEVADVFPPVAASWHSDPAQQIHYLESSPFHLGAILANTVVKDSQLLSVELVGMLGWLSLRLPRWYYEFYADAAFVILLLFLSLRRIFSWSGLIVIAAALASIGAVLVSIYVLFSPPGSPAVENLQGRYFIPTLAFLALLCHNQIRERSWQFAGACALWVVVLGTTLTVSAQTIEGRYYITGQPFCATIPRGNVDEPAAGAKAGNQLSVRGWAAAPEKIARISIFVDGALTQTLAPNAPRPDVDSSFPDSPDKNKGWSATLDLSNVKLGQHEIIVQAVTANGCEGTLGDFPVDRVR
ncbi:MAG TPA: DUF2142 domain-containing protein [Bryobacteraceae bacterium]|jgi:hypothetical protein|nr:DUF2142 domain-containing protein [Bryobacteraceae bacterium]